MADDPAAAAASDPSNTPDPAVAAAADPAAAAPPPAEPAAPNGKDVPPVAAAEPEPPAEPAAPSGWPKDWRERIATHAANGDKKAYDREMKRLERMTDPEGIYGSYREIEARLHQGGLVKVPGENATEAEIAAYRKALGVPEKPEGYLEGLKLDNDVVIGDMDKPMVEGFLEAMHQTGASPTQVKAALNWYYAGQEQAAAAMDQADNQFREESVRALKEKYGPSYERYVGAIASLFAQAPGGADFQNPESLASQIAGARLPNGRILGNDPTAVDFMISLARELNPVATVTDTVTSGGKSIDDEIGEIESFMKTNRHEYFKDNRKQARYRELLEAREKNRARNAA